MSIRKKPEGAVSVLLARLDKAKEQALGGPALTEVAENALSLKFKDIEEELGHVKNLFPKIKTLEESVIKKFCDLEQELDDDIFNLKDPEMDSPVHHKLDHIKDDIATLKIQIPKVDMRVTDKKRMMSFKLPTEDDHHTISQEWFDLGIEGEIFKSEAMSSFLLNFHRLGSSQVKMCLLCLSIFPENIAIQKKPLIYWWMGEGIITKTQDKTAEDVGELVLQELLDAGFIRPSSEKKTVSVNSFIVCPWIRRMLILMAQRNKFLKFDSQWMPCNDERRAFLWQGNESYRISNGEREEHLLTVFNVNEQYLGMTPEWLDKLKRIEVLQIGRWQNSVSHHIEVEKKLLNGLGSQKHLKYLSLRGISRIETLPPSILKLISLKILDLRACHNLEKLPSGMSELKNLTHLDVSECYLLESMPKGLDQLHNLQVLKGFVIGKAKRNTCKISDLEKLNNLRKLSIRVSNQGETQKEDQLGSLVNFSALRILTISWGVVSSAPTMSLSLPESLTKLDLRCVPFDAVPEWLWPSRFPSSEKLYIRGGKLRSLEHQDSHNWKVKFLRLKYLEDLEIDEEKLVTMFPEYLYLEKTSRRNPGQNIILDRAG